MCDVVLLMDGDGVVVEADVCVVECVVDEGGKSCWVEGECLRGRGERSATGKRRVAERRMTMMAAHGSSQPKAQARSGTTSE